MKLLLRSDVAASSLRQAAFVEHPVLESILFVQCVVALYIPLLYHKMSPSRSAEMHQGELDSSRDRHNSCRH